MALVGYHIELVTGFADFVNITYVQTLIVQRDHIP